MGEYIKYRFLYMYTANQRGTPEWPLSALGRSQPPVCDDVCVCLGARVRVCACMRVRVCARVRARCNHVHISNIKNYMVKHPIAAPVRPQQV